MELLLLSFLVDGAEEHTAGLNAHHGPGRQIRNGDAGLADQVFRLIIGVDSAQNRPILAAAVVQSELQELLGLLHRLAIQHLNGTEIRLGEGVEIRLILEQRLNDHIGKVDLLRLGGRFGAASVGAASAFSSFFGMSSGFMVGNT